ncbi:MAG: zf-HC2 domain-containing protein [Nitrospinota bacterium]|nr:zf-HC2 domain-containing protein [Nitrospinota bacterium]
MKCSEILEKISAYLDKELDPALCQEIENHVHDCEPCVAFLNTMKKTVELYNAVGREEPPIPEQVSGKLLNFLKKNAPPAQGSGE